MNQISPKLKHVDRWTVTTSHIYIHYAQRMQRQWKMARRSSSIQ